MVVESMFQTFVILFSVSAEMQIVFVRLGLFFKNGLIWYVNIKCMLVFMSSSIFH